VIVECPGCLRRYDVTGRPPGTLARCRCQTVFELPEPREQARMLSCPKCGGDVAATNHACEYCGAELLVKACPRCFARIFHGAKHCDRCGASSVVPATANTDGSAKRRACPRCDGEVHLVARLVDSVLLDECGGCHGVFVDAVVLQRVFADREPMRGLLDILPTTLVSEPLADRPAGSRMYVPCPDCGTMMNRINFGKRAGVIVDVCKDHGTWFDADELPRVIEFVLNGGIERTQKKDMQQLRDDAHRAQSEARVARMTASGSHSGKYHEASALAGFIGALPTFWVS